jgi:hypothetical protein
MVVILPRSAKDEVGDVHWRNIGLYLGLVMRSKGQVDIAYFSHLNVCAFFSSSPIDMDEGVA